MARLIIKKKKDLKPEPVSLKQFHETRNRVLFIRETGGLGDILMHRMFFKQAKEIMPDATIVFACPARYHDAVKDHPYIDEVVDTRTLDKYEYLVSYNTTSCCTRHELAVAPLADKHRSDIWANHCGIKVEDHDMHIHLEETFRERARKQIASLKGDHKGPIACLCPVSAMITKNLLDWQNKVVVEELRNNGCWVYGLHTQPILDLQNLDVPVIHGISIRDWMGLIDIADYVVTVDSAAFHFAGNQKKPMVGIFTFADGKVYGKYFDFVLVQKHRDDGDWSCGPCYNWAVCPFTRKVPKPCLTEICPSMLKNGINKMFQRWPTGINVDQNTQIKDR